MLLHVGNFNMADRNRNKSASRSFKKKSKGKGSDDSKRTAKPKKFKKDLKGEKLQGQKRKSDEVDDKKDSEKSFKSKKWNRDQKAKGHEKNGNAFHRTYSKDHKKGTDKWKGGEKPMKRKQNNDHGENGNAKRPKMSESKDSEEKPNIWQMKKKERKHFRKKQDENYDLVSGMKQLYETIRRKNCSKTEKVELVDKILDLIAGHSRDVIFKHDTGRVIQSCIKFGTMEQRQKLFEQFKDDFGELIKSKYSKFFVKKFLLYGTKKQRDTIIKCFYGQVRKLIRHKEASSILETVYSDYANSAQKAYLIQEFYGADFAFFKSSELNSLDKVLETDPSRKTSIIKYMKDALLPLVDRSVIGHSIVHRVLLEYFMYADEKARSEMIEVIRDYVVLILHTHDGARVGMHCFWHGTAKDRKILIKSFKSYYLKICKEEFGHLVILALFDSVDDTVLVKKVIFPEIKPNLEELALDTYGRKVLMYLLCPRCPAHFHPSVVELLEKGDDNTNSKKQTEQRRRELLEGISPLLLEMVEEKGEKLLFDKGGCQLVVAVLLECIGNLMPAMTAVSNLANRDIDTTTPDEDHIIKSAAGHFALKRLVQKESEMQLSKDPDKVLFSKLLVEHMEPGVLFEWCKVNRGAFVVTSLLESKMPGVSDAVRHQLKPFVAKLKKIDSKGVEIVTRLLEC